MTDFKNKVIRFLASLKEDGQKQEFLSLQTKEDLDLYIKNTSLPFSEDEKFKLLDFIKECNVLFSNRILPLYEFDQITIDETVSMNVQSSGVNLFPLVSLN
mgnify:CR=1 FL=1